MKYIPVLLVIGALWGGLVGCSGSGYLIKKLPPSHQEFIKSVHLIISKQEKAQFLNLNSSEDRESFIKDFWKKRDPDPLTEINEFKEGYFQRIAEANRLFGKKKGWLTDRGRVLVLLGPPETKRVFPTGYNMGDLPAEVWFYGVYNYPIIFVDRYRSGGYELSPLSAQHIATIQRAIQLLQPVVKPEGSKRFDFDIEFKRSDSDSNQVMATLLIPFKNILFEEKDGKFHAGLAVKIEIQDQKGNKYPDVVKRFKVAVTREQIKQNKAVLREIIPLQLGQGSFEYIVTLASPRDNMKVTKKGKFNN
jgi:GWxTD domain-containing protein